VLTPRSLRGRALCDNGSSPARVGHERHPLRKSCQSAGELLDHDGILDRLPNPVYIPLTPRRFPRFGVRCKGWGLWSNCRVVAVASPAIGRGLRDHARDADRPATSLATASFASDAGLGLTHCSVKVSISSMWPASRVSLVTGTELPYRCARSTKFDPVIKEERS